jgi:dTDP-4-amino-4,6-dideoxygalactose transaminase
MTMTLPLSGDAGRPVPFIDLVPQYQAMSGEVLAAVERVLSEQKFILGEEVAALETEIAAYCQSQHAIGCNSGTDALILALQALDIGPGDEVITTPFSFFATASAICRAGATPVFADILPDTFNIDPQAVEDAITPRTKAIVPVHLFGQCADMDRLQQLATQHGLAIIEDACQAIGAEHRGRRAGVLGHVACFSFFPTKNLGGAGDGGMLTTDNPQLAQRLKRLRVHGDAGQYEHIELGMNSRLDALQAAVLRVKLRHLDEWNRERSERVAAYTHALEVTPGLALPRERAGARSAWHLYTVRARDREGLAAHLAEKGIATAVHYPRPIHLQPALASAGGRPGDLPVSERLSGEVLSLPLYPELPLETVERIAAEVRRA